MASLLLDHGADPSAANHSTGWTAAMQAAQMGDLETVKLLAKRGADFAALSDLTLALNINQNHPAAAAFIDAVVRWPPIRIAVACRAPTDLGAMLRRGLVDTIGHHSRAELIATATSPAELWPGQPAPCPATARLAREAMAKWSLSNHRLHHANFRAAVYAVLLTAARLTYLGRNARRRSARQRTLPALPEELWLAVLSNLLRRDWAV